jgi:hypothetical protein
VQVQTWACCQYVSSTCEAFLIRPRWHSYTERTLLNLASPPMQFATAQVQEARAKEWGVFRTKNIAECRSHPETKIMNECQSYDQSQFIYLQNISGVFYPFPVAVFEHKRRPWDFFLDTAITTNCGDRPI